MTRNRRLAHLLTMSLPLGAAIIPTAAAAQDSATATPALADEVARLSAEVDALKAEIKAMRDEARQERVESAQTIPPLATTTVPQSVTATASALTQVAKPSSDAVQMTWKGAPEFRTDSGWSFKPRGRLQVDASYLSAPSSRAGGQADGRGVTSRVRRAYLGAQGTMPGGFGYRIEADLAGNSINWTDLFITYDNGPFNVTIGQHHPFTQMEQLESDLFLTFVERAAFMTAFNFERRVGLSGGYHQGPIMINAGVFTDDISALNNDGDKSFSVDGRIVFMPKLGDVQLHFGASAHRRTLSSYQASLGTQYRTRPYIGTTDIRYVDTGLLTVNHETQYGVELAMNWKRVHAVSEAAMLKADRPGSADPTFWGGYAEAGIFLTNDTRGYKNGQFDRTVPTSPLGDGGLGALEMNVRYDTLDLTDAGVTGGKQDSYGASLVWTPVAYVRFIADLMHLIYDVPGQQPKFNAEVVGLRAQVDF